MPANAPTNPPPPAPPAARPVPRAPGPRLVVVAAVARNGTIGHDNGLVWRIPEDLAHFKRVTLGHPVLMGRRTWEGLPARFRPLPGRRNLVLTRQAGWQAEGAEAVHTLDEAVDRCQGCERLCVIGGAELWALALPRVDELILTEIDQDFEGDTAFPPWDRAAFEETTRERLRPAPPNDFGLSFVTYRRRGR